MKTFKTPASLHDVFGESQSLFEVVCTLTFAVLGTVIIFVVGSFELSSWQVILAFLIIADVLAGCVANFSRGTNSYYAKRPKNRLIFIAVHVHIIAIAWLLDTSLTETIIVWLFTTISAFLVNALKGQAIQTFVAANLMCLGLILLVLLQLPNWLLLCSVFFMIKVLFSFAVDHYDKTADKSAAS